MRAVRAWLVDLHPAWSLLALLVLFWVPVLAAPELRYVVAIGLALQIIPLLWAHGIHDRASQYAPSPRAVAGDRLFVGTEIAFAVVALLAALTPAATFQTPVGNPLALIVVLYFVSFWFAATALTQAETRTGFDARAGTFLLLVYWCFGTWVLRKRLRALASHPPTAA